MSLDGEHRSCFESVRSDGGSFDRLDLTYLAYSLWLTTEDTCRQMMRRRDDQADQRKEPVLRL